MKFVSIDVCDILEGPIKTLEPNNYIRFKTENGRWINVELRNDLLTIRGSHSLVILPDVSNQFSIDLIKT